MFDLALPLLAPLFLLLFLLKYADAEILLGRRAGINVIYFLLTLFTDWLWIDQGALGVRFPQLCEFFDFFWVGRG